MRERPVWTKEQQINTEECGPQRAQGLHPSSTSAPGGFSTQTCPQMNKHGRKEGDMSTKTPIRAGDFIVFCWEMLDGARTCIPHPPHPSQPDPHAPRHSARAHVWLYQLRLK